MRFRPEQHLRRPGDFRTVRELGRRIDCGAFTLWHLSRPAASAVPPTVSRVGVVASNASVGAAVQRTRAKRRMRELFRQHQALVPPSSDLVLVARAAVNRWDYPELEQKFTDACRKLAPSPHV
ncbi:MAG: rnpA [Verrucomicrobia bacterium]|nr:rnpA [Verrucomicrobiota bacterium]